MNNRAFIGFMIMLLLPGCFKVGPDYCPPKTKMPGAYTQQKNAQEAGALANWWASFNDFYLNSLVKKALTNNYDFIRALEKIKETRALYGVESARLWPEIDVVAAANRNRISQNLYQSALITQPYYSYFQMGFDAIWELDLFGRLKRIQEAAFCELQVQQEVAHDVYVVLVSDVARTYIDVCALQKNVFLLEQKVEVERKLLVLVRDRYGSGIDSKIQPLEQKALLEQAKSQLLLMQTALKQTINRLAILLGEQPEQFVLQAKKLGVPQSKTCPKAGLPSELLRRRPDIRQAERQIAVANARVGEAIGDWFPRFPLLGSVGVAANQARQWFLPASTAWSFGPSVLWPVFTSGRIGFNVDAKKSVRKQAVLLYEQAVVNALKDVENALIAYFNERDRVAVLKRKLSAVTGVRDLIKVRFDGGLDNEIDYLFAEAQRLDVAIELTDAQQALSSDYIALYKALGGGWDV